ncbi:uncharacterized protein LOC120016242 isoform X2 [Tripterygium wilfordii]|uniref:uncharacterized protein LOC120016242 isoform X2 n=1 Tax=Tripterygium wilfordii TaxID=458696 RepID=UPI0018F8544B|nr:uncharacterized protein LOC120016242 isoform X2 [Tripterygium wilfordii]
MASMIVTGDRYLEKLVKFVEQNAGPLIEGSMVLKLNPAGLHYVQLRLEALRELELLLAGAPVDYLRAYVSDLGDHRALEQLRRILRLLTSLKVFSVLPPPGRDPTPLSLLPFGRLRVLELRGCDLSTSAAKGLLELRHTLEKIICHNSTDALRHIFASRIAEIKDSPQWNRLWFVSCASNQLVLMDESLQLLPAVETLDLSRNKFAKVDNLRRCTKLKHLDLGFNQLRTIAPFDEVSCHIVKLVLRNNALTTLRGIENLRAVEALDVSYNIISNFSELEFLAGLSSLHSLWLEGNPLCCARWYRAQVFSYFIHPAKLKLDDKEISNREFWKMQILVAGRHKRPSSFGYYSPVRDEADGEGSINIKRRKISRLASIVSEEESIYFCSDQESASCDNEIQSKEENVVSDNEAEIVDLMNKVELMKKERSVFWLREFKEWMDHSSENLVDDSDRYGLAALHTVEQNCMTNKTSQKNPGESSRYASDTCQASGDESTNIIESESSFADISSGHGGVSLPGFGRVDLGLEHHRYQSLEGFGSMSLLAKSSIHDSLSIQGAHTNVGSVSISPLSAINDATESHSSYAVPGSPPHFQEDILHRRHNLVEEILQLSAESYSVASSDSYTSCSEDDLCEFEQSTSEVNRSLGEEYLYPSTRGQISSYHLENNHQDQRPEIYLGEDSKILFGAHAECWPFNSELLNSKACDFPAASGDGEIAHFDIKDADCLEKRKHRRKPRKKLVSLLEEDIMVDKSEMSRVSNGKMHTPGTDVQGEPEKQTLLEDINARLSLKNGTRTSVSDDTGRSSVAYCSSSGADDFLEQYFNANVADSRNHEICMQSLHCDCILGPEFLYREREVVLLLSSENKLYVLLPAAAFDRSASIPRLLGCHKIVDVRVALVGVGLQVVRVCIESSATYLFITRSMEKSRQLLCILQILDTHATNDNYLLRRFRLSCFRNKYVEAQKSAFSNTLW